MTNNLRKNEIFLKKVVHSKNLFNDESEKILIFTIELNKHVIKDKDLNNITSITYFLKESLGVFGIVTS